ncbi:hypothetical protein Q8G35_18815 [Peribacillus simplex]|uniref:Uncharacterized protein n=2 Tax=Peribacillus TaxID=2675229 RepID=A0AA90PJA5_9BACI|nr:MULTISPECIES: hypothetical protein [Peribacillus]MDP1420379.1 hypothetical protein [Peribacillus simplex]MDP1453460.1 hypothetical protein [Peribacillus frigoritolerans]
MGNKFFPFALALILVLSIFGSGVSAKEKEKDKGSVEKNKNALGLTVEEFNNLISLGFTEEEIENMDQKEYELNKDLKGEVVASTTQYLKITEPIQSESSSQEPTIQENSSQEPTIVKLDEQTYYEELAKENESSGEVSTSASDSSSTSYKKMTTSITKLSTNNYRLKNSVTWSKMPFITHVDVTGVGINQTYWGPTPDTQYGKQNWTTWSFCNGTQSGSATYTSSSGQWKKGAGGYALKINLPNDETASGCASDKVETLSSYMYYSVKPLTTTNRLDAYGQYAHQESTYTLTPSIALSGVSFSVSPTNEFAEHPNTHVLVYK